MGNLTGSSWGLKGSEDLGGGLKAIFQLENGFDPGNGQLAGGRLFGNQAFVGLASERYGTLTLGRQYDPLVDLVQGITAGNDFGSAFATAGDVDNYDNSFRVNNAVKYASPALSGLRFEAMYAFGGVAGRVGAGQSYSAGLAYELGPFSLAGGYFQAANTPAKARWREDWAGTSDGTFNGPVNTAYASARSIGITRVAARYVLGAFTFGAGYSHARWRPGRQFVIPGRRAIRHRPGFPDLPGKRGLADRRGLQLYEIGRRQFGELSTVVARLGLHALEAHRPVCHGGLSACTRPNRRRRREQAEGAGLDRLVCLCGHERADHAQPRRTSPLLRRRGGMPGWPASRSPSAQ